MIQWNGHRVFGVLAMSRSIGMCFVYMFSSCLFVQITTKIRLHVIYSCGKSKSMICRRRSKPKTMFNLLVLQKLLKFNELVKLFVSYQKKKRSS